MRLLTNLETEKAQADSGRALRTARAGYPFSQSGDSTTAPAHRVSASHDGTGSRARPSFTSIIVCASPVMAATRRSHTRPYVWVHAASRGIPRLINIIGHKAMLLGLWAWLANDQLGRCARRSARYARGAAGRRFGQGAAAMSVINTMLKELDQRNAPAGHAAMFAHELKPVPARIGSMRMWLRLSMFSAAGDCDRRVADKRLRPRVLSCRGGKRDQRGRCHSGGKRNERVDRAKPGERL